MAAISKQILPTENLARAALRRGDFQGALDRLDQAEAQWRATGLRTTQLTGDKIEAHFGKGNYAEVLDLVDSAGHGYGVLAECAKGLSLIRLGRAQDADAIDPTPMITRYMSKTPVTFLPGKADVLHLEASLRLARGVEFWMTGERERAKRELLECVRILPNQPVASYILAKQFLAEHEQSQALPFARAASVLPGLHGKEARAWVEGIEH